MGEQALIDAYCERTAAGLWDEPFNLVSNAAFLIAALSAARRLAGARLGLAESWDLQLLTLLLAAIGVGSALWHSYATRWAALADIVPITLFMAVYLLSFLARIARLPVAGMLAGLLAFEGLNVGLSVWLPADTLNGSVFYLPALVALVLMWLYVRLTRPGLERAFLLASLLFTLSLAARTLDNWLCSGWPTGTHFLWHLLNAELLRRLILALLAARTAPLRTAASRPA